MYQDKWKKVSEGHHSTGYRSKDHHSTGNRLGDHRSSGHRSSDYHSSGHRSGDHCSSGHRSDDHHSHDHHSTSYHSSGHRSSGHHSGRRHSTGHHSSSSRYKHAHSQNMTNKPTDYTISEHHSEHSPVVRSMLANPAPDKSINITLVSKKVDKIPEQCLKPFSDSKNIDKTKVFEILPKQPKTASESLPLNIRSGISPLIYCKQSQEGKQSGSVAESDKSSSLEKKVTPASLIISQRNCVVQRRREERQSFEDRLVEVEEKRALDKKTVRKASGHSTSYRSDSHSGSENVVENASQHSLEPVKTSKHEKVYKSATNHLGNVDNVSVKHVCSEQRESVANQGIKTVKYMDGDTSQIEETSNTLVKQYKHDTNLNQGSSFKAVIVDKGSDKNKHSYLMDKSNDMNSKCSKKISGKQMSKSEPLDYGNLYLYCIRKSYRLKHCNWNQSSETLLRMLKKKYKSLKLMIPNKAVICVERCRVNMLVEGEGKEADTDEQTTDSKIPMAEESERNSTKENKEKKPTTSGEEQEEGSLVDPRVMSLSKTLLSSNTGKVGQDKTFKKHTPAVAHHKSSQKPYTQLHKKHSKPDWSKLKEKLKAISSKPVKKVNDGIVVEKNSIKTPMNLGTLFVNQVPQFKIPKKPGSKSRSETCESKSDSKNTVTEPDKRPTTNMQEVSVDCNDRNTVLDELTDTRGFQFSGNTLTVTSVEMLAKPDNKVDYSTPDELIKVDRSYRDDEDNFEVVPMDLSEETVECIEVTEPFDLIPDLYAEKPDTVMKDDTACDISPPVLEKAFDTSPPIDNQNDEQSKYTELDNEMLVCYGNIIATKDEELENCQQDSAAPDDDKYNTLPVHTCNTEQQHEYSNFEIFENSDSDEMSDTDELMENKEVLHNEGDEELPVEMFDDVVFEGSVSDNEGLTVDHKVPAIDSGVSVVDNEGSVVDMVCSVVENEVSVVRNEDYINENEVSGVNREVPVVDNEVPVIVNEGYTVAKEVSNIDNEGYTVQNELPAVDNEIDVVDNEVCTVEKEVSVDNSGSVIDKEDYIYDIEVCAVDNEDCIVENEVTVGNECSAIGNEGYTVENKVAVDNELSVVDNEGSVVLVIRDVYSLNKDEHEVTRITNCEEDVIGEVKESIDHSVTSLDTAPSQSLVSTKISDENDTHHEDKCTELNRKPDQQCLTLVDSKHGTGINDDETDAAAVDLSSLDNGTGEPDVSDCPTIEKTGEKQTISLDQNKLDTADRNAFNTEENKTLDTDENNEPNTEESDGFNTKEENEIHSEDCNDLNSEESTVPYTDDNNEHNPEERNEFHSEENNEFSIEVNNEFNIKVNNEFCIEENNEFCIEENTALYTEENSEFSTEENSEFSTKENIKFNTYGNNELSIEERNERYTEDTIECNMEYKIVLNTEEIKEHSTEENNKYNTDKNSEVNIESNSELNNAESNVPSTEENNELNTEDNNELHTERKHELNTADNNILTYVESNYFDTEVNNGYSTGENTVTNTEESTVINTEESTIINTEESNEHKIEEKIDMDVKESSEHNPDVNNDSNTGECNEFKNEVNSGLNTEESVEPSTEENNKHKTDESVEPSTQDNNKHKTDESVEPSTQDNNKHKTGESVEPSTQDNNKKKPDDSVEQSCRTQQPDFGEPMNDTDAVMDDCDKMSNHNLTTSSYTEDVKSDNSGDENNEAMAKTHASDSKDTCLEPGIGIIREISDIGERVVSEVTDITCSESGDGLVEAISGFDETVERTVSEETDNTCLEQDKELPGELSDDNETVERMVSDTNIVRLEPDNSLNEEISDIDESVERIVSENTGITCLEPDNELPDELNDDNEILDNMSVDETCVESDTNLAEQCYDKDAVVDIGHTVESETSLLGQCNDNAVVLDACHTDDTEDYESDRSRHTDGESGVNDDIHTLFYEDMTESSEHVLDDVDDSCSLPDIEPPTVQVIEHKDVPLDVTTSLDEGTSLPSNHNTPTDDATCQGEDKPRPDAKSPSKSKTVKEVTANEKAEELLPANQETDKLVTANEQTDKLVTANEQTDKLVTANEKGDTMELSEEKRLVRDFPNHNWLFNKYNCSMSESTEENNHKTIKKKKKDSSRHEKIRNAGNQVDVPQKPDRLDCRLSDCLQGFKSDKTNIETNIKFGWNKKCNKRGLNAFGKSFHNKVNLINNVLDIDEKNKVKPASGSKKTQLVETKVTMDMAVKSVEVCKTFNTTSVDKPTLAYTEPASGVLNLTKNEGDERRKVETASEVTGQPDEVLKVQNKEIPLEASDGSGNKLDSDNTEIFESNRMVVEEKRYSRDRSEDSEVDVCGDVRSILQEMSDNVVESSERNAQPIDKHTIDEVTTSSYDVMTTGMPTVEDISDADDADDDAGDARDADDAECRLEIDESVEDLTVTHHAESIVLNAAHDVIVTPVTSDNLSTSVTSSVTSSSTPVTKATETTEIKQATNTCEEKSQLDTNTIKPDNTEVNFRQRSKPPVQLVHPQVHKPVTDPESSHQTVQEVHAQHTTFYQGTEVQNTRPISSSWTQADSVPAPTTNVTSTGQLTITPSVTPTNSSTNSNSNQIVFTRVHTSASVQGGHLSSQRTVSSAVLSTTAVPIYGSGLVIPIQPFMQNINLGPNQNVLQGHQQLVQNTILYDPSSLHSFVHPSPQNIISNFTGKNLSPVVHAAVQKPSLDLNQGHMLTTQSGSLPQQRGLNSRPYIILPKTQVPPLHASQLVTSRAMVPAEPLLNPHPVQQIPFQSTTMTENYTTPAGNDRNLFLPSTKVMAEKTASSTKDIAVNINPSNNCKEPEGEDDLDDEIKKQMEELDAEIKRKEHEQEEMRRKKLELLDKMKQAKLASKPKQLNELNSGKITGPVKVIDDKSVIKDAEDKTCNRKRKYSGDFKDEPIDNKSVKTCKDVVLNSVSSDTCDDLCVQNPTVEVSSVNLGSKVHEDLSVTVTDGVISITDNRIKDDSGAELSGDDSVLDLALSTNILVTDREVGVETDVADKTMICDDGDKIACVRNEVHTDYTTSKEFIKDIGAVNPFTGEYDGVSEMVKTESEAHLNLSIKSNIQLNEKKQTLITNELENDQCEKQSLKSAEKEFRSSQDTDTEYSLCIDLGNDSKPEKDTNIYSQENTSDTALNLVKVVRHSSSVSEDKPHDHTDQELKSISSIPTSTQKSIYFTPTSRSSVTSSTSISTSSINISYSSGLSLVSSCSSSTPSEISGTSILSQSSITNSASTGSVKLTPHHAQLECKLTDLSGKVDKLTESNSSDFRDADAIGVEGTRKLASAAHKDTTVDNEEPLNLMKNSKLENSEHEKYVKDDKAKIGESRQGQDLSVCLSSSNPSNVPLNLERTFNKCVDKAVANVPFALTIEAVPVTQSKPNHAVTPAITGGDTNNVKQLNNKVMYIQDKPVSVQNINGALRLAAPVGAVVPDKQTRSRDKKGKNKQKFTEIQPAHQISPPPPKKPKNANPEPAHIVKATSSETLKKMNRSAKYKIPLSICQSSPHFRRLVANYFSPREWTKPFPKPWQKRQPKPAHIRRPFGIAGHLIVSSNRRRKRTISEEHLPSPKFYSLPNTPTTPPSTPERVSSASDVAVADNRITYKRSQSESMEISTSPNTSIAHSDKNFDPDGAPIRAHCRPRSSANKELFYETSVFRPPSMHKNIDNLVPDRTDIIDLTCDIICVSESGQKKATKKSLSTEKTIQEELNQAMSKRQRLDFEESTNKSLARTMSKAGDGASKALNNRIDPELVRKTLMRPPPPYTGRQRMPVLAQFPRRLPFDQPRIAHKTVTHPQAYTSENLMPVATRMPFNPRGLSMDVPRVPNPLQQGTVGNTMTQNPRWSQSPPFIHATVEPSFPSRPAVHDVRSPEFTAQAHGIRHAPVAGQSAHEYVTSHGGAADTVMLHAPVQSAHRQPVYPGGSMVPAQPIRTQHTGDTRFQQHGVVSPAGYHTTSPGYRPKSPGYPSTSPGYPTTTPGYPPKSPGYRATSPGGYPPKSPGYRATSPGGYPPKSPGYPSTSPGYLVTSPGYPPKSPGSNIGSAQRNMVRHPNMVTQPSTNIAQSVLQPRQTSPGYPNPPYPTQVHQLLQKPAAAHQPGGQITPQMYPPVNPAARSHVTSRGEAGAHVSQSVAHSVSPGARGYSAQGYGRDIPKGQGQAYPTGSQNPYSMVNRGNTTQMPLPGDVSSQMVVRGQHSPASSMLPRRSPGVGNVESNTTSRQSMVGQYPIHGNLTATQQHALEEQLRASRLASEDQARATQLAEEQQLQNMQRIRAQHIRSQQMQVRSPPGGATIARFQDPVHQQHGASSQANPVAHQESRLKLQQQTLPTDLHRPTSAQLQVVDPASLHDARTQPQGQHLVLVSGNQAKGQGHAIDYAQMNNETVMAQSGSQMVPNPHINYTTAQEISSMHPGSTAMTGRHLSNSGQLVKNELMSGHSVKGQSSPGNPARGHVILPQGQGQMVQYTSANIAYKGQTAQGHAGHARPADRDISRQSYSVVVQGQETPVLPQRSPKALTFSPQQSVHQSHVNITQNRHILPKPFSHSNNYTQNVTSQPVVAMATDLSHPQQLHQLQQQQQQHQQQQQQQQQAPFVSSTSVSPQTPSTDVQHSPQNLNISRSNQVQGQISEGQMDSDLPHLQQVHGECILCGKYSLYLCSSCKQIWYCSPECQLTHWQTHAAECTGPS